MPGPMPMQPSYPSMNAPVQMAPAPQPQGSERSSNEPQASSKGKIPYHFSTLNLRA